MARLDAHLQRLLKMAALVKEDEIVSPPFGFDTRIVARWRELQKMNGTGELVGFVRRVALVALVIMLVGGVATYRQISENEDLGEALTNEYAIADSTMKDTSAMSASLSLNGVWDFSSFFFSVQPLGRSLAIGIGDRSILARRARVDWRIA